MNLLLDTHIWIWTHLDPKRLSRRVTAALTNPENLLWLSPISIWETLLIVHRGRIRLQNGVSPADWIRLTLSRAPVREAPLNHEVALRSREVTLEHEDPADRFLAATAAVHELVLVTADEGLLRGKGYRTLANR